MSQSVQHVYLERLVAACTTSLTRFALYTPGTLAFSRGSFIGRGRLTWLSIVFDTIAGGAATFVLQLTWKDDNNSTIMTPIAAAAIRADPASAADGSYNLNLDRLLSYVPADATGIWIGIDLDAGTANAKITLEAQSD